MAQVDCKVVIIGCASTGKTCLLQRYVHGSFNPNTIATIGGAFSSKTEQIENVSVVLGCWDTAGSERYASMTKNYYRGAQAAVICFDLTDKDSFNGVRRWVAEIMETIKDCKMYLCGNKKDLIDDDEDRRAVSKNMARNFAIDIQADYFETSSKTGENIESLFRKVARDYTVREEEGACFNKDESKTITSGSWRSDPRVRNSSSKSCCRS